MKKNTLKTLAVSGLIILGATTTAFASSIVEDTPVDEIMKVYEENSGNGLLLAPNPNAEDLDTASDQDDTSIDEIMEVYEENSGNGLLLAPNPNAEDSNTASNQNETSIDEIMEVYQENSGNGLLLAPNPNAEDDSLTSDKTTTVEVTDLEEPSFMDQLMNLWNNFTQWLDQLVS